MHSTSRLILNVPDITDNESAFPVASSQQMTTLDNAVTITRNTISARPAATAVPNDTMYYATDTGLYYVSNGSAWLTVMLAGAWVNLTLSASPSVGIASGSSTPAARPEGDTIRLRGTIQNNSGAPISPTTKVAFTALGIVTHSAQPGGIGVENTGDGGTDLTVVPVTGGSWANGATAILDGITFPLS
jgi:hypothetical protein